MNTVIVTGANAGIGFATARFLARLANWRVVLACRNESKAHAAIDAIRQTHPGARLEYAPLDLFSLASVRRFPDALDGLRVGGIHALALNAGGINMKARSPQFTEDGFEQTFQLNFLGHFLLANLLVERLAADARVVFVSSDLHDPAATKMGKLRPPRYGPVADLAYATGSAARMHPMRRYATAKLYAMMIAYEFDRRFSGSGPSLTVNSWSPGVIPTTQAGRDMPVLLKMIMTSRWFVRFMGSHLSTEDEAARALGGLLTEERYAAISGRYFDGFQEIPSSLESRDSSKARSVWEQSARLAGLPNDRPEREPRAELGRNAAAHF